jgi:hypothetical protein
MDMVGHKDVCPESDIHFCSSLLNRFNQLATGLLFGQKVSVLRPIMRQSRAVAREGNNAAIVGFEDELQHQTGK